MSEAADDIETGEAPETNAPETQQPDPLAQVETAARAGGWVPKDEWKGDADKWVDAPAFVLKAAEILPHVNNALREAKSEIRDVKKTLADFAEHHSKTEQRAYERAVRELQERMDAAASVGDVQGVRAVTDELIQLQRDAAATPKRPAAPQEPAEFTAWKDDNPWFGKDKGMTAFAGAVGDELVEQGYSGAALVREVDKRIKAEFPHKFENPARKQAPSVEGAGAPPRARGKTYSDLPPDAKAMCDDFVKRIPGFKRETYIKDYFGS